MIKVFTGPMFAGKTTALLAEAMKQERPIFIKPIVDNRSSGISTHDGIDMKCYLATSSTHIVELIMTNIDAGNVFIDEVQFFDKMFLPAIRYVHEQYGKDVYVAGLDLDSNGNTFGSMGDILAIADEVVKLTARCDVCSAPASKTFRVSDNKDLVFVGGKNDYQPRCLTHWRVDIQ